MVPEASFHAGKFAGQNRYSRLLPLPYFFSSFTPYQPVPSFLAVPAASTP